MTRAIVALALAALYLGVLGSVALFDVAMGLCIGAVLAFGMVDRRALGGQREPLLRLLWFPRFLLGVAAQILRASAGMILVVLGARDWRRQGFVEVDIGGRTPVGVTVSALVTGLSPGSVVVDVDWQRRVMLLHVIDASDEERVRRQLQDFYARYQAAVFP